MIYEFSRLITKRKAINRYGKLGYKKCRESVYIEADSAPEAVNMIEPYNYKKHIRFEFLGECLSRPLVLNQIIEKGEDDEKSNID